MITVTYTQLRWWSDLRKVCGNETDEKWFDRDVELKLGTSCKIIFWEDR